MSLVHIMLFETWDHNFTHFCIYFEAKNVMTSLVHMHTSWLSQWVQINPWSLNFCFVVKCNTSGKCEDMVIKSLSKSDRLYCMEECQNIKSCQFSSYSEAKNQCLLFNTCYKLNMNESLFSSSKMSCDLPPGGTYVFVSTFRLTKFIFKLNL